MKTNNIVAKHARTYNKATVMEDRKKQMKKGYTKHKGGQKDLLCRLKWLTLLQCSGTIRVYYKF